jgi:hypothetical protein
MMHRPRIRIVVYFESSPFRPHMTACAREDFLCQRPKKRSTSTEPIEDIAEREIQRTFGDQDVRRVGDREEEGETAKA